MTAATALEQVMRERHGRLLGVLVGWCRDIETAEEALAGAYEAALSSWDAAMPDRPDAWLLTTAKRRVVDAKRRSGWLKPLPEEEMAAPAPSDWPLPDPRLRLLFACTMPSVPDAARVPLMLQTVLGLTAERIAPLFLMTPAAMGQLLVRAKRQIAGSGEAFTVPMAEEWPLRLPPVLDAVYGALTVGLEAQDETLIEEAVFLAQLCAGLGAQVPEALGLAALCLLHGAQADEMNPALIAAGEAALHRAAKAHQPGRYQIEAAIQSAHVDAHRSGRDHRAAVVGLYRQLVHVAPSAGARVGLAAALLHNGEAEAARDTLDRLPAMADYQPYFAVRAAVSRALGDTAAAEDAYTRAIVLARSDRARALLEEGRASLGRA